MVGAGIFALMGEAAAKAGAIVLTNTAVIEEHGPHMSCGIDTYLGYLWCKMVREELEARGEFSSLPDSDLEHLSGDIRRAYEALVVEFPVPDPCRYWQILVADDRFATAAVGLVVIQGILGGEVPTQKYVAGIGLGAILSASGIGGLGILVGLGFYLPFNIVLTYTIGTVLRVLTDKRPGRRFSEEVGIPVAAGLIVGEALVGVGFALFMVFGAVGAG